MPGRARIGLGVLPQPLDQADDTVDLAPDAIVGDDRLLPLVQHLDLRRRPMGGVAVAPGVLLLVDLGAL